MKLGCFWPDPGLSLASTVGKFIVIGLPELFNPGPAPVSTWPDGTWQHTLDHNLGVILTGPPSFGSVQDTFMNENGALEAELRMMRAHFDGFNLPWPIAIMLDEEWYTTKLHALLQGHGPMTSWPLAVGFLREQKAMDADPQDIYVRLATHVCMALERAAAICKRVFPDVPVGHIEAWWEDDPAAGWAYHPYPRNYDFLGVDAYCPGPITRDRWDRFVGRCYAASARYGKPLLMCPQTFTGGPVWTDMPTVEQLGWWLELPRRYDIRASAVFALHGPGKYDRRHPPGTDLRDFPDRLRAVQDYAAKVAREESRRDQGLSNWAQASRPGWF